MNEEEFYVRFSKQYLYDKHENQYLDCSSVVAIDAEANDLAIRLSSQITFSKNILAFAGTFVELHQLPATVRHAFVVANSADGTEDASKDCVLQAVENLKKEGIHFSCFLIEPFLFMDEVGFLQYPQGLLKTITSSLLKDTKCLTIVDESRTGLGRLGTGMWAFTDIGILPDLVVVGVILGNGFPLSAVLTSRQIAAAVPKYYSTV
ncbi:unnamed protein product [Notodromas monacha]|uniref:Uncharacterized protein n=1 Tax=Notodromas monacha TaxID=399045 RepID=A0A7R9GK97_9CRUS|nr:unnamed protein product [Notodromas monacha]CAG0924522.1 unnamed protein product [Notodromas monacha]